MEEFALNAIGRYGDDGEWGPFHMDENGNHRDQNGLMIMPFDHVKNMTGEELAAWMADNGVTAIKLNMWFASA